MENFDVHFTAWHQHVWKPVICAVNGICAGGGVPLGGRFRHRDRGVGRTVLRPARQSIGQVVAIEAIGLIRRMPAEAVMRMAFVGKYERMNAQRAYELGMISQIVDPPEQLREEAQKLAETVARNSPTAMRYTKKALWGAFEAGLTEACKNGAQHLVEMWGHPDQEEGPARVRREARSELGPLASTDSACQSRVMRLYGPSVRSVRKRPTSPVHERYDASGSYDSFASAVSCGRRFHAMPGEVVVLVVVTDVERTSCSKARSTSTSPVRAG